ncbi:hypothetical protein DFJ73DRAFT_781917 [Zopfochytrium polystomum]|nr:hypothetical protein DFJ73DRAFT_781917 [Zopfochytrium polystomum]
MVLPNIGRYLSERAAKAMGYSSAAAAATAAGVAASSPSFSRTTANPVQLVIAALSRHLAQSTHNAIRAPHARFVLELLTGSAWRLAFFMAVTEFQFRFCNYFYSRGVLARYQKEVPMQRNVADYVGGQIGVVVPVTAYAVARADAIARKQVVRFEPGKMLAWHFVLFVIVDAWYYFGHRIMHKNKFLWNNVHHKHHTQKNISVWSTAYASFFENTLLVAPPLVLFSLLFDRLQPRSFNALTFLTCLVSEVTIFVLGHSGFKQHPVMYLLFPPAAVVHAAHAAGVGLNTQDHEMHHLYPLCNYSLNFSFWDRVFGTYKDIEHLAAFKKTEGKGDSGGDADAAAAGALDGDAKKTE